MKTKNIFANIPKNLKDEIFENILSHKSLKIERIISKGHSSPESLWYDQNEKEWIIVLQGKAILSFANEEDIVLDVGDYLNIPAHKKHKVLWTQPDIETIWIAIYY